MAAGQAEPLRANTWYLTVDPYVPNSKMIHTITNLSRTVEAAGEQIIGRNNKGVNRNSLPGLQNNPEPVELKVIADGDSSLKKWFTDCNPQGGGVSQVSQKKGQGIVFLTDTQGQMKMQFTIANCYPIHHGLEGELSAGANSLVVEHIRLMHEGIG